MKLALGLGLLCLSACLARAAPAQEPEWPLEIDDDGTHIVLYQPQPESLKDDKLAGRAAVSVTREGDREPTFGALWLEARVSTDRDARTVTVLEVKVLRSKFPGARPEEQNALAKLIGDELQSQHHTFSLDRLLTTLDGAIAPGSGAEGLEHAPPHILFATEPTVLVTLDGAPQMQAIPGSSLMSVVNTPFLLLCDLAHKTFYLQAGERWARAARIEGPWSSEPRPPAEVVSALPPRKVESGVGAQDTSATPEARIVVVTEPTELIVCQGAPKWTPLPANDLLYLANSENEVFLDVASQRVLALLAGRWYTSASLERGKWTYVPADELPDSFADIPPGSEKGAIRTFVGGTDEARDALLDASIPQTSVVKRSEAHCTVTYDGAPRFDPIEGTQMHYAVNTGSSVVQCAGRFYCCSEAVWFVADAALGPWSVCTQVPPEVYTIPPSCPIYPVRYVYVYDSTPEYVYAGYLPGYVGCYAAGPTIVYGTGYWYPGWYGSIYYPRPWTYGFRPHYQAWNGGWSLGFGFGWGMQPGWFALSVGWGSPGWWGQGGFDGDGYQLHGHGVQPHSSAAPRFDQDFANHSPGQSNIYKRGENASRNHVVADPLPQKTRARVTGKQPNDVYADRDGRVLRRSEDGWQERAASGWKAAEGAPSAERAQPPKPMPASRPARPVPAAPRNELESMREARERGNARAAAREKSRPAPPAREAKPRG